MFRIGEFASLGGVSAKMLRAYDALALFRPVWVDPTTSYRYYSPAQLPELRRIVALRHVGVPLAEIAGLVAGGEDLRAVLDRRRSELERERGGRAAAPGPRHHGRDGGRGRRDRTSCSARRRRGGRDARP